MDLHKECGSKGLGKIQVCNKMVLDKRLVSSNLGLCNYYLQEGLDMKGLYRQEVMYKLEGLDMYQAYSS